MPENSRSSRFHLPRGVVVRHTTIPSYSCLLNSRFLEILKIVFWRFHACIHHIMIHPPPISCLQTPLDHHCVSPCQPHYYSFILLLLVSSSSSFSIPFPLCWFFACLWLVGFRARVSLCSPDWPETMVPGDLKLLVLFPSQPPKCWDCGHELPFLVLNPLFDTTQNKWCRTSHLLSSKMGGPFFSRFPITEFLFWINRIYFFLYQ